MMLATTQDMLQFELRDGEKELKEGNLDAKLILLPDESGKSGQYYLDNALKPYQRHPRPRTQH